MDSLPTPGLTDQTVNQFFNVLTAKVYRLKIKFTGLNFRIAHQITNCVSLEI